MRFPQNPAADGLFDKLPPERQARVLEVIASSQKRMGEIEAEQAELATRQNQLQLEWAKLSRIVRGDFLWDSWQLEEERRSRERYEAAERMQQELLAQAQAKAAESEQRRQERAAMAADEIEERFRQNARASVGQYR